MMDNTEYFYRETNKHIRNVQLLINEATRLLLERARTHDVSKFDEVEKKLFVEVIPEMGKIKYGSEEYKTTLAKIKPAIEHHNKLNPHHPEHYYYWECNGCFKRFGTPPQRCDCGYTQFQKRTNICGMNLIDLIEMLCDWIASSKRNPGGDIIKSIELNQKRFGYSDELKQILLNTAHHFTAQEPLLEFSEKPVEGD